MRGSVSTSWGWCGRALCRAGANVTLQECADDAQTWKRMSQWSQVVKKKEKQANITPRRYAAEKPNLVFEPPPPLPLLLQKACSQHFMWPENSPGWCTEVYWSPESQMALVYAEGVLVGFINKSDLVRDTDGCWPESLLYSHLSGYKKEKCFGNFFTCLSFIIPRSLYYSIPMSNIIIFNITVPAFSEEMQKRQI